MGSTIVFLFSTIFIVLAAAAAACCAIDLDLELELELGFGVSCAFLASCDLGLGGTSGVGDVDIR